MTSRSRFVLVTVCLLTTGMTSPIPAFGQTTKSKAPEWPGFRGPERDGIARDATPPVKWNDETTAWKTALPGPGSSSPIVIGNRVYVTCYSGYGKHLDDGGDPKKLEHHLVCVNRSDGKIVWTTTVPGPLEKEVRQVILNEHGFASPTPITDGETIYCYFGRAGLCAIDLDGKVHWQSDLGQPSKDAPAATNAVVRNGQTLSLRWGSAASPALHDGLVIVNASEESNSIHAFDAKSGFQVWRYESANLEGCASSPAVVGPKGKEVCVMVPAGAIWGLDPATGKLRWKVDTESRGGMSPTPVADAKHIYAFGGSGESFALHHTPTPSPSRGMKAGEAKDEKMKENETAKTKDDTNTKDPRVAWTGVNLGIPSPLLYGDRLYLVDSRGFVTVISAADGTTVREKERLDGRTGGVYASPVLADGRLYVVSRERGTFVYTADENLELLAKNELTDDSQFNGSPAAVDKDLFLRSDKYLYCVRGK